MGRNDDVIESLSNPLVRSYPLFHGRAFTS